MSNLKEAFESIRPDIQDPKHPARHYGLLPIQRQATSLYRNSAQLSIEFDPEALEHYGINASEFRRTWALGFAQETLAFYSNLSPVFGNVVENRCLTCLDVSDDMSFGNVLPDDVKERLRKKYHEVTGRPAPC